MRVPKLRFAVLLLLVSAAPATQPGPPAPPLRDECESTSPAEAIFRYGDRLRAGDREGAMKLLVPRTDESNTLLPDEMRRWSVGSLDFVVLGGYREGENVAIIPIVFTGNGGADAHVVVRREGVWKVCYLPDYKTLAGYKWSPEETESIRAALRWFYAHRLELGREAQNVTTAQGKWSDRAPEPLHYRYESDPNWREKEGLR